MMIKKYSEPLYISFGKGLQISAWIDSNTSLIWTHQALGVCA
jgi:hypothetical protein